MTLDDALEKLGGPARGLSIGAVLAEITALSRKIRDCRSDFEYWGYLGDLEYWRGALDLMEAARITENKLPDIAGPEGGIVVLESADSKRKWCALVLWKSRRQEFK